MASITSFRNMAVIIGNSSTGMNSVAIFENFIWDTVVHFYIYVVKTVAAQ